MRRRTSLQPYTDQEKARCVPRGMRHVAPPCTRQRVRYRSLAARKPKELRSDTESLSLSGESDPLPTTTRTKGLS